MNLLILGNPNSPHIIKWVISLANQGVNILVFGLNDCIVDDYNAYSNIQIKTFNHEIVQSELTLRKFKYLNCLFFLKRIINDFKPDILHAHYATSYGLLGALTNFHPFIISVWGTDIYSFPKKTFMHKLILKYNLKSADKILSTSHAMAKETMKYTEKKIDIIPFGINLEQFKPMKCESLFSSNDIVIGTIKALEDRYGIEYLIKSFNILYKKYNHLSLKLLIVGSGSLEQKIRNLILELELSDCCILTGNIPFKDIPIYQNMIDIFVALSKNESFGVSVIESSSCSKPVVVSNVGGLPEVVFDGITGYIVPSENIIESVAAIEKLVLDKELRLSLGRNGRKMVEDNYNWNENVLQMLKIYEVYLERK